MSTLLTLAKGDTGPLVVTVSHTTLGSSGLANYHAGSGNLWFYGKLSVQDADADAIFKKNLASGVSVAVDGSASVDGVVNITLAPADTSVLPDWPISLACSLKGYDGTSDYTFTSDITLLVKPQATSKVS